MQVYYGKEYSPCLNRDMEFKVYGYAGTPILVFPSQNGRFYEFEDFKMIETVTNELENGEIQIFTIDSIDLESWSDTNGNEGHRIYMHEQWYHYICDEFVPRIHDFNGHTHDRIITTGCSMGATHSMNFFLRRPDLFGGVLSMSGVYSASFFFPNYQDSKVYDNSPLDFLPNMPADHPWMDWYRKSQIIFVCGLGAWEDQMYPDARRLKQILWDKGVDCWYAEWGTDTGHDWPWWRIQFPYYVQFLKENK
ncbi:MAG: esterase family protein [Erysipelotrichaceae bacterium]|nr:esterase family protein [Erysipelotrichaceae bacterium]